MKLKLLNFENIKSETIKVSDKIFNQKINHKLIKSVIDWQLNHMKPRTAKTKQKNEIKGSTKKIVPQKGSGGARHASRKSSDICRVVLHTGLKVSSIQIKKNKQKRLEN